MLPRLELDFESSVILAYSALKAVSYWFTAVSQRFHSDAAVVLQWCYSGVTVVLQWCYSGATVVLQYY
jgi:hypothetical protein